MLAILGYLWQYTIDKYLRDYSTPKAPGQIVDRLHSPL